MNTQIIKNIIKGATNRFGTQGTRRILRKLCCKDKRKIWYLCDIVLNVFL